MKKIYCTLSIMGSVTLLGCKTYHMSTQSLQAQFAHTHKELKVTAIVSVAPFIIIPGWVKGNSLREVKVLDKKEREHTFPVTYHTEVRITKQSGKRVIMPLSTVLLTDSTITGSKTNFFKWSIKPIKFSEVKKIELQK